MLLLFGLVTVLGFSTEKPSLDAKVNCDKYKCGKLSNENYCIEYFNNMYNLKPCTNGKYCPPIDNQSHSVCLSMGESTENTAWPGEPCTSNSTCAYGYCNNGICKGKSSYESCKSTEECDVGLRCSLNQERCIGLLDLGESSKTGEYCMQDYDCVNYAGCNVTENSQQNPCVEYLSVKESNYINCNNDNNMLCTSMNCYESANLCTGFLTLGSSYIVSCEKDSDCKSSTYPTPFFYTTCECGYNPEGTAFCNLFPGDKPYQEYYRYLQKWLQSEEVKKCHSMRRLSMNCMKHYWDEENYLNYAYWYYTAHYFPKLQNNDDCSFEIYNKDYKAIQERVREEQDWSLYLTVSAMALTNTLI